jgi:alpha/beta superfamily hydrolase
MISEDSLALGTSDGVMLDALLAIPPGAWGGLALCHPHPLYGGDMDNPVIVRAAEVGRVAGLATLRFNFRGVGGSGGRHGGGDAEQSDLIAALVALRQTLPAGAKVIALGYSFGAGVAVRVAAATPLDAVALVALPLGLEGYGTLPEPPHQIPVAVIAGSDDQYCPPDRVERLRAAWPRASVTVIPGANHFFFGKLFPLGEALRGWLERLRDADPELAR